MKKIKPYSTRAEQANDYKEIEKIERKQSTIIMVFWSTDTHSLRPFYNTWPVYSNLSIFRDQSQKMWHIKVQNQFQLVYAVYIPPPTLSLRRSLTLFFSSFISVFFFLFFVFSSLLFFGIAILTVIIELRFMCHNQTNSSSIKYIGMVFCVYMYVCVRTCEFGAHFSFRSLISVCILLFRHQDAPILSMACQCSNHWTTVSSNKTKQNRKMILFLCVELDSVSFNPIHFRFLYFYFYRSFFSLCVSDNFCCCRYFHWFY